MKNKKTINRVLTADSPVHVSGGQYSGTGGSHSSSYPIFAHPDW